MADLLNTPETTTYRPDAGAASSTQRARRPWLGLALLLLALSVTTLTILPARAAVVLERFEVEIIGDRVELVWETSSEYNVEGFSVYCKEQDQPDSEYMPIGSRPALGGPQQGMVYSLVAAEPIDPGKLYCFRLREITTDGTAGDIFDRCGYGIGITPTPSAGRFADPGAAPQTTATPVVSQPQTSPLDQPQQPQQPQPPTPSPTFTWTPSPTPTATPVATSPLAAAPETTVVSSMVGVNATPTGDIAIFASQAQTADATPTASATVEPTASATVEPAATPTASPLPEMVADPASGGEDAAGGSAAPGVPYVVWTATPTPEPQIVLATLTPLPSATATPSFSLASLAVPTTENLTLMLLCFMVVGGSGIGILGIVALLFLARSRTDNRRYRRLPPPYRDDWFDY